uniref:Uncharacterized protein n=1 Tax=Zooxanthella nutricula TaxID=1333877 RepID=A0A6U6Q8K0_9DINO|mmetsp:Transcript_65087/g.199037  ORF Transcript_65087/g.199037 Transcript_65087/m.199037 type:complete len:153 (+) Transcript_65087:93-551(+)
MIRRMQLRLACAALSLLAAHAVASRAHLYDVGPKGPPSTPKARRRPRSSTKLQKFNASSTVDEMLLHLQVPSWQECVAEVGKLTKTLGEDVRKSLSVDELVMFDRLHSAVAVGLKLDTLPSIVLDCKRLLRRFSDVHDEAKKARDGQRRLND